MTRRTISGVMGLNALSVLADPRDPAQVNRPDSPALLARECARLLGDGLSIQDVAAALHLSPSGVAQLLTHLEESTDANP